MSRHLNAMYNMQPTYEELAYQNQTLSHQLRDALADIKILKAHNDTLNEIQSLRADNEALLAEIRELKDKLNTNSKNSSKPPSQDPFKDPQKRSLQEGNKVDNQVTRDIDVKCILQIRCKYRTI